MITTPFVVDALVKTTVLLALVALATFLLRRRSAAVRHLLWTFGIAGLIAIPSLIARPHFRLRFFPVLATPRAPAPSETRERNPASGAPLPASQPRVAFASVEQPSGPTDEPARAPLDVTRVLLALWLVGALVLLARFALGLGIVAGIRRRALPVTDAVWRAVADRAARAHRVASTIELRRSDEVSMPFACGVLRPVIVLPSSCDDWSA